MNKPYNRKAIVGVKAPKTSNNKHFESKSSNELNNKHNYKYLSQIKSNTKDLHNGLSLIESKFNGNNMTRIMTSNSNSYITSCSHAYSPKTESNSLIVAKNTHIKDKAKYTSNLIPGNDNIKISKISKINSKMSRTKFISMTVVKQPYDKTRIDKINSNSNTSSKYIYKSYNEKMKNMLHNEYNIKNKSNDRKGNRT